LRPARARGRVRAMTNGIAIGLALAIVALFAASAVMGWDLHIFLGRKLVDLIDWIAFWR
jgi:hypothetical protein